MHCFIDTLTAHRLNSGKEGLEDLLVIRVEGGIDHYVAIAGHYNRSSFGMSLQELVVTPSPAVQTLLPPARMQVEASTKPSGTDGGNNHDGTRDVDGGDLMSFVSPISSSDIHGNKEAKNEKNVIAASSPIAHGPGAAYRMSIPKELWRMIDNLWSAGAGGALRERDLFIGLDTHTLSRDVVLEVAAIRDALDDGSDLPSCSPHSVIRLY